MTDRELLQAVSAALDGLRDEWHNKYQETRDPYWEGRRDAVDVVEIAILPIITRHAAAAIAAPEAAAASPE